jgi:predicted 2-oxoglutarate/Fe(II)-dependent dioxygenase YbiX
VQHHILELKKFIPQDFCNKIILYFDKELNDAQIGVVEDSKKNAKVDKSTRNCQVKHLFGSDDTFGKKLILNYLKLRILHSIEHYKANNPYLKISEISQIDFLKYESNSYDSGYIFHVDHAAKAPERSLSISICLNNKFEGGEFIFNLQGEEHRIVQNVGDCVIFPSNFLYPHQVNKITYGTRYAIVAWVI